MSDERRCNACDESGRICADCGMCDRCAFESIGEGEGFCHTCVGDVLAFVTDERDDLRRQLATAKEPTQFAHSREQGERAIRECVDLRWQLATSEARVAELEAIIEGSETIEGPCSYCELPDHWRPDCPQIPADAKPESEVSDGN